MNSDPMYSWSVVSWVDVEGFYHEAIVIGDDTTIARVENSLRSLEMQRDRKLAIVEIPVEMISYAERTRTEATLAYFATRNRIEHP